MAFRMYRFRICGLGPRVWDSGFAAQGLDCRVSRGTRRVRCILIMKFECGCALRLKEFRMMD